MALPAPQSTAHEQPVQQGLALFDSSGRLTECSMDFAQLLGQGPQQLQGLSHELLLAPAGEAQPSVVLQALRTGKAAVQRLSLGGRLLQALAQPLQAPGGDGSRVAVALSTLEPDTPASEWLQRQLEAEREQFRSLADELPHVIWTVRPDGMPEYFNRRWYEYTGIPPGMLRLEDWVASVHPEDLTEIQRRVGRSFSLGEPYEVECRYRRHDGAWRWFLARAFPVRDTEGRIIRWVGSSTDIDDQKHATRRAELERREAEQARAVLDTFFNAVPAGMALFDRELRYVRINRAMELLDNLPEAAHVGRTVPEVFPELPPQVARPLQHVLGTGETLTTETTGMSGAGEEGTWLSSIAPVRTPDGQTLGVASVVLDITEQRRAQQALRESEARMRRLFESGMVGIFYWDLDGRILEANSRLLSLVGYSREELQAGLVNWRWLTPPEWAPVDAKIVNSLRSRGVSELFEKQYVRKDGTRVDVLLGAALFEGSTERGVTMVLDISDRKRAETERSRLIAALERSNSELDQFAYVASHDLKAPLRGIANLSQWLEDDLKEVMTDETREQMRLLRGRVQRMEALINGILNYSRAGREQVKPERVDVGQLLADCLELLSPPPEASIELGPGMPTLHTERVPLQQLFLNLVNNAIKHAQRRDVRVRVSAREVGDFWEFSVADNGRGIAPEYHERIWGIFQTLSARDEVEGTGIGLSVVKKSVEVRGGRVWLESSPGQGATFFFTWPKVLSREEHGSPR